MRHRSRILKILLLLVLALPVHTMALAQEQIISAPLESGIAGHERPSTQPALGAFRPGRILVRWQPGEDKDGLTALLDRADWPVLRTIDAVRAAVVQVPEGEELAAIAQLKDQPLVASAHPAYWAYTVGQIPVPATAGYQPTDPSWSDQWAARRSQLPLAWEISTGASTVTVAIIDTGIDLSHPDFSGRVLTGYNYINNSNRPQDDHGHGTHIAGIIAAAGDNQVGVAGTAWRARLLPLKVLDSQGIGDVDRVVQAVLDASARGAGVINLSLALTGDWPALNDAVQIAVSRGAVVVSAAGNNSVPGQPPAPVSYPAAYPDVIAVAATSHWEEVSTYSNGGPQVELAAPGGEDWDRIISTSLGGDTGNMAGTSMAAAYVTGVVALLRAVNPQASRVTLANALRNTADKVGSTPYVSGRNDRLGYGRVNAAKALRQVLPPQLTLTPNSLSLLAATDGPRATAQFALANPSSQPLSWQITEISQDWLDLDLPWSGTLAFPATTTLRVHVIQRLAPGLYTATIRLRATTLGGQQTDHQLAVNLHIAPQLSRQFLPLAQTGHWISSWEDTTTGGGGVGLSMGNDQAQPVGLPFIFPYYGRSYNQVWVHANGFLSFERDFAGSAYATNGCVPSLGAPNGAIYALWDDLDPGQGGQITYRALEGNAMVFEWREVPLHGGSLPNTFQVVLQRDGRITIQYAQVANPASATVGLENWDNTMGWQVACNGSGAPPAAGSALLLRTTRGP